jgi:RNA polymerase sigma-70 factor (ECF subfamily)
MASPHIIEAFEHFIGQHKGIMYKIARAYCNDPEDLKDLVQEIILQLWRSFDRYQETAKRSTWTYRVALNVAISWFRKDHSRRKRTETVQQHLVNLLQEPEDPSRDVHSAKLHRFISELKEIDRALIILHLEERSQKEIAEILGMTETNVSTRKARAIEQLRKKFQQQS